jgi:hypothetical protein
VKRFEIRERGRAPLPAIDLAGDVIVIGSGPSAGVRLPAEAARAVHVRVEGARWIAIADAIVDGTARPAGDAGELGDATTFAIGAYDVRIERSPAGATVASPQRTESLARELVRGMLGGDAAPVLRRGTHDRPLAPPDSTLVIGRGDEADWVILDGDLSREHAAVKRSWDGVTIRDLGSKNGTRVDGKRIEEATLHDGARIELGTVVLEFRDPAERHLRGGTGVDAAPVVHEIVDTRRPDRTGFVVALAIAVLAAVALVWVLAS